MLIKNIMRQLRFLKSLSEFLVNSATITTTYYSAKISNIYWAPRRRTIIELKYSKIEPSRSKWKYKLSNIWRLNVEGHEMYCISTTPGTNIRKSGVRARVRVYECVHVCSTDNRHYTMYVCDWRRCISSTVASQNTCHVMVRSNTATNTMCCSDDYKCDWIKSNSIQSELCYKSGRWSIKRRGKKK